MLRKDEEMMKEYGILVEESKKYIYEGHRYDKLEDAVNYAKIQRERAGAIIKNTSGQGEASVVPDEVKKWSWGAFFLNRFKAQKRN